MRWEVRIRIWLSFISKFARMGDRWTRSNICRAFQGESMITIITHEDEESYDKTEPLDPDDALGCGSNAIRRRWHASPPTISC